MATTKDGVDQDIDQNAHPRAADGPRRPCRLRHRGRIRPTPVRPPDREDPTGKTDSLLTPVRTLLVDLGTGLTTTPRALRFVPLGSASSPSQENR
ncbi:hypothetical protein ACIA6C_30220 [Streptomyces sp. NPDC051578]|uniref:hypothetical protein n=1 Tax=Streptomyces sp. NPDC051578 TaxID=3365662 RepID=UPI003788B5B3